MSTDTQAPAIAIEALTKNYGPVKAIDSISFTVNRGEVVGFLGPNGAGKSTTMRILCGLTAATSGIARVCGEAVASHPERIKRRIGYMPENNPLPEDLRVDEYLRHRARLKEIPMRQRRKRVEEVMEVCQLNRTARRKVIGTLSKGYRQRVGIADAILAEPDLIIMDEPTIGLDPHQIITIRELIASLRGRMTVVISSHILPEIELMCDRVIIINRGRVVASGTSESLRHAFMPQISYRLETNREAADLRVFLNQVDGELILTESVPGHDTFWVHQIEHKEGREFGESLLRRLATEPDLRVRDFARCQPGLEQIFMAATKQSWKETLPPFAFRHKENRTTDPAP